MKTDAFVSMAGEDVNHFLKACRGVPGAGNEDNGCKVRHDEVVGMASNSHNSVSSDVLMYDSCKASWTTDFDILPELNDLLPLEGAILA